MTALKRHGGWRSASTIEGYNADSNKNKLEAAKKKFGQINPKPLATATTTSDSTSTTITTPNNAFINSRSTSSSTTNQCSTTVNDNDNNNITKNFINNR